MKNPMKAVLLTLLLVLLPQVVSPMVNPNPLQSEAPSSQLPTLLTKAQRQVLRQIAKNHPNLEGDYAIALAVTFETVAKQYKLKPHTLAAIAMQESTYQLDRVHCYKIKGKKRCDYCMMQINDKTAHNMHLNVEKLLTDMNYCVDAGAKVLKDFEKRYKKSDEAYWTRYHSSDPGRRAYYQFLVERYL